MTAPRAGPWLERCRKLPPARSFMQTDEADRFLMFVLVFFSSAGARLHISPHKALIICAANTSRPSRGCRVSGRKLLAGSGPAGCSPLDTAGFRPSYSWDGVLLQWLALRSACPYGLVS